MTLGFTLPVMVPYVKLPMIRYQRPHEPRRSRNRRGMVTASCFHRLEDLWSLSISNDFDFARPITSNLAWALLLAGDGHIVRQLRSVIQAEVYVRVLPVGTEMDAETDAETERLDLGAPSAINSVPQPWRRRHIELVDEHGHVLVYAASWWNAEWYDRVLGSNQDMPFWEALDVLRIPASRDVQQLYWGDNKELEKIFCRTGPFWARHYLFAQKRVPFVLVYEVFSPYLEEFLGEMTGPAE